MNTASGKISQWTPYSNSLIHILIFTVLSYLWFPFLWLKFQWIPQASASVLSQDTFFSKNLCIISPKTEGSPVATTIPLFLAGLPQSLAKSSTSSSTWDSLISFALTFLLASLLPSSITNMPLSSIFPLLLLTAIYSTYTLHSPIYIDKCKMENSFPRVILRLFFRFRVLLSAPFPPA